MQLFWSIHAYLFLPSEVSRFNAWTRNKCFPAKFVFFIIQKESLRCFLLYQHYYLVFLKVFNVVVIMSNKFTFRLFSEVLLGSISGPFKGV